MASIWSVAQLSTDRYLSRWSDSRQLFTTPCWRVRNKCRLRLWRPVLSVLCTRDNWGWNLPENPVTWDAAGNCVSGNDNHPSVVGCRSMSYQRTCHNRAKHHAQWITCRLSMRSGRPRKPIDWPCSRGKKQTRSILACPRLACPRGN